MSAASVSSGTSISSLYTNFMNAIVRGSLERGQLYVLKISWSLISLS